MRPIVGPDKPDRCHDSIIVLSRTRANWTKAHPGVGSFLRRTCGTAFAEHQPKRRGGAPGVEVMNSKILLIGMASALLGLAACNKAESPSEVQEDVAKAEQEASRELTDAQQDQADNVAEANRDASEERSESSYDVAVTRAEGEHKVAVEKCEAQGGAGQEACKEQADAALEMAKADAKAAYPQR
jgi:hypothetical protein